MTRGEEGTSRRIGPTLFKNHMDSVGPALDESEEQAASTGPLHSSGWQHSLS